MTPHERSPEPAELSLGVPAEADTIVLELRGPITRADVPELCERARLLMEAAGADHVVCDLSGLIEPDVAAVDVLARLQLTARRQGGRVRLRDAQAEFMGLVTFVGLLDVVPCEELVVEPRRKAEEGEHPSRVEEEDDPADPSV